MKKWMILPVLAVLYGLSGCQHKDTGFAFTSQRQYRHRLFTGGYEFIKFKPDGRVYAEIRQEGINVITTGDYFYQIDNRGNYQIGVFLDDGPRRMFSLSGYSGNSLKVLTDLEKSQTWKLHRVLSADENKLM